MVFYLLIGRQLCFYIFHLSLFKIMFLATCRPRRTFVPNFDSLFESFWNHVPQNNLATDIRETDENFELELGVPGAKKEDFKIFTEKGYLSIAYENKAEAQAGKYNSFDYNGLHKRFALPDNIDVENIKADYVDGILRVQLPKKEVEDTKAYIEIN